jgi:hypothetical protein
MKKINNNYQNDLQNEEEKKEKREDGIGEIIVVSK